MANLTSEDIADLLLRVEEETEDAKEELEHAQSIIQSTGLTVHSSVINNFAGGDATAISSTTTTSDDQQASTTNNTPAMDLQQEAALAVQARHKYNPMRGTLSAFPLVLTTTGGHQNTGKSVCLCCFVVCYCVFSMKSR